MGNVIIGATMSLDWFMNDRNGDVSRLYPDLEELRQTEMLQEEIRTTGAVVMGRRAYDMAEGDLTDYEYQVPIFVLTHHLPQQVVKGENDQLTVTFVTDGIHRTIEQANSAAKVKEVACEISSKSNNSTFATSKELNMSMAGLSKSRLERMHHVLSGYVERQEMPGLVALVSHQDGVHVEALGTLAFGDPAPIKRDTIFRIASITKLITAVAVMILVEECKLRLDDSIEPWLPELANRRVLKSISSDLDDTVPALRAITLRDLLTYRMGFGSVMAMPDTYPIQKLIREYRIGGDGPMLPSPSPNMDEWLQKLGSLPLLAHPVDRPMYHVRPDLLSASTPPP